MFVRFVLLLAAAWTLAAQQLPVRWDELVASDWKKAIVTLAPGQKIELGGVNYFEQ